MKILKFLRFLGIITLTFSFPSFANDNEQESILEANIESEAVSAIDSENSYISVLQAIDLALKNNLDLEIGRFAPDIAAQEIIKSESEFTPILTSSISQSGSREKSDFPLDPTEPTMGVTENSDAQVNMGITKKFEPGTLVSLETTINRTDSSPSSYPVNPYYDSGMAVTVQQPLLRNRGKRINLANLSRARSGWQQSLLEFRRQIIEIIAKTESNYWDVAYEYGRKNLEETGIQVAEQLLEETREKERLGLVTQLEVLQAEASLASRREALIIARQRIDNAEDAFQYILGLLSSPQKIQTSRELPEASVAIPDFAISYRDAREFDFNMQIQQEILYQSDINLELARNGKLPAVDLAVTGGVGGNGDDFIDSYKNTFQSEDTYWTAGVTVSLPWGFKEEKATLKQAELILEREKSRLDKIEQDLMLRVRNAWRELSTAKERLHVTNTTLNLREEQFLKEKAKFDAGLSTFRNVLETQEDLDRSRQSRLDALISVLKADIALSKIDGSILPRHGFGWERLDPDIEPYSSD